MPVGLKLKITPLDKLFPEEEKRGVVKFGIRAQNLLNGINVGLAHALIGVVF
jgi:hypothetical protein